MVQPAQDLLGKNICVVTCSFGTGHKTTASALDTLIKNQGGTSSIYNISEDKQALQEFDLLYKAASSIGIDIRSQHIFNTVLEHQAYGFFKVFDWVDRIITPLFGGHNTSTVVPESGEQETKLKNHIKQKLTAEKVDLVITTHHMQLNPFREVCAEANIPLIHVATDFDVKARDVFRRPPQEPLFRCIIPDNNDETLASSAPIPEDKRILAGIPLRQELYRTYTNEEIANLKLLRGIDPEAKVILVMSGGGGQEVPFPELLLNSASNNTKYHMIVVAGANNRAGDALNQRKKEGERFITGTNPLVTVEVAEDPSIRSEERRYFIGPKVLSELFAIADCGFSKPGGVSMYEYFQTGVPVLADRRQEPFDWEDFNIRVMQNKGRGIIFTGREDFLGAIDRAIALQKAPRDNPIERIVDSIKELLNASTQAGRERQEEKQPQ